MQGNAACVGAAKPAPWIGRVLAALRGPRDGTRILGVSPSRVALTWPPPGLITALPPSAPVPDR